MVFVRFHMQRVFLKVNKMENIKEASNRKAIPFFIKMTSTIQAKLFLLLLAMLIPVLLIEAFIYFHRFQTERIHELEANLQMARAVGEMFDGFIQDVLNQEVAIGTILSSPKELSPERAQKLLQDCRAAYPNILDISWVDPNGKILLSTRTDAVGKDLSDRSYLAQIEAGKSWVVSNLLTARISHQSIFTISRGIRNEKGSLLGVVVVVTTAENLDKILSVDRIAGGEISLVDSKGILVYHHPGHEFDLHHRDWLESYPILKQALNGRDVTATSVGDDFGRKQIVSFAPIPSIGWVAGYARLEKETMGTITINLLTQGGLFGLVAIAAFLVALGASRGIVVPARNLQNVAANFGRGQLGQRVEIEGPTELRDLGEAFNQMAEEIGKRDLERQELLDRLENYAQELQAANEHLQSQANSLIEQKDALREAHDELEKRVQERTAELARANESLQREISERMRAQQVLVKQNELLESIFSTVHFLIAYMDSSFNFIRVNTAYATEEGRPQEFFLGKNHFELYPDEENQLIFQKVVESGQPYFAYEKPFVYPEQSERGVTYWDWSLQPLKDSNGVVDGLILSLIDRTESARARESLRKSEKQLRILSSKLLSAQEEERKRISRELHDSVGSSLSAIKLTLESAIDRASQNNLTHESIEALVSMTQNAIDEARRMMNELRPSMLDDLGLVTTIGWFCKQFRTIYPTISVEENLDIEEQLIPADLKTAIFRIVQESFNNIAKYSKAEFVELSLEKRDNFIGLKIKDNGSGFDLNSVQPKGDYKGGLGLASMKERAELLGGHFKIESKIGSGTTIQANWPLHA